MNSALARTFEFLAKTPNEAAVDTLIAALDHSQPFIRQKTVEALLSRRGLAGHHAILDRADKFPAEWQAALRERRGRMSQTLRKLIVTDDAKWYSNARKLILWGHEYDLAPALISALEDTRHTHRDQAGAALIDLAGALFDELWSPPSATARRDPQLIRRHMVTLLEESVERFRMHKRREPIEALLMLATRESNHLRQILIDSTHSAHAAVVELLHTSVHPGVIQLLASFLEDAHPLNAALETLSNRADLPFVSLLLSRMESHPAETPRRNLSRLVHFAWLAPDSAIVSAFDGPQQAAAVRLLQATGVTRATVFETLKRLCTHGNPEGRRAAIAALSKFPGSAANELVLAAAESNDPETQATAIPLLKSIGAADGLDLLLEKLESPHDVVRNAAREALSEFSFERFSTAFETLDDGARRRVGGLVKKVDAVAIDCLRCEMHSSIRARRIRAFEMAPFLEAVSDVEAELISAISDRDHFLRAAACRALCYSEGAAAYTAICRMQDDASTIVREAATAALAIMDRRAYRLAAALPT